MLFHWHHLSASEEAMGIWSSGIWSSGIWSSGFGVRDTIVLVLVLALVHRSPFTVHRSPFTVHRSQAQSEHRPWCSQPVGFLTPVTPGLLNSSAPCLCGECPSGFGVRS